MAQKKIEISSLQDGLVEAIDDWYSKEKKQMTGHPHKFGQIKEIVKKSICDMAQLLEGYVVTYHSVGKNMDKIK